MSSEKAKNTPSEGELVVVSVTTVKQNGAYVSLDEFEGVEGFIFIGEIASGWVKNIRAFVREGQRLICKVMRTRKDGTSLELSLKSVSEERRRDRLQEWKNEQRAHQLLKVLGEKVGWSPEEISSSGEELSDAFGGCILRSKKQQCMKVRCKMQGLKATGSNLSSKLRLRTLFLHLSKSVARSP